MNEGYGLLDRGVVHWEELCITILLEPLNAQFAARPIDRKRWRVCIFFFFWRGMCTMYTAGALVLMVGQEIQVYFAYTVSMR